MILSRTGGVPKRRRTPARCNRVAKSPTEPLQPDLTRREPTKEKKNLMDNTQDELKAHLMQTDQEFRRLVEQHSQYDRRLDEIESKPHVTPEDEIEEHRIKKLKLHLKDQMNEILGRHRTQSVA